MIHLPRSTYYYRSTAAETGLTDKRLIDLIGDIQDEFPGYGYRRVTRELKNRGHVVNHKRVARVMKEASLGIKPRKRYVKAGGKEVDLAVFPNLYRNVIPVVPDKVCRGHYLHSHCPWLCISGCHSGCLQSQSGRICDFPAYRHRAHAGRSQCHHAPSRSAPRNLHSPYGPRQSRRIQPVVATLNC